jgi:hypothetical protein
VNQPATIYLDTVLWNTLCDRAVDPQKLIVSLAAKNANLTLGLHNFYELAKTFRNHTREASERGQRLLSYLNEFIDAGILCVKENDELLAMEMWALKKGTPLVDSFFSNEEICYVRKGVENLATGGFDERTDTFINNQRDFASEIRLGQKQRLESRPDAKQYLKSVSPEKLNQWLQAETRSAAGSENLRDHIRRRFPQATETEAAEYASALLASPMCRMAGCLVRAGSYYMWRCAYRDSVPGDLFDDMYHVLNSVYSDVYATREKKQEDYAGLLVTDSTTVAIYSDQMPIDQWLQDLI